MTRPLLCAIGTLWLLAVGAGLRIIWRYENAPGAAGASPADWPADSAVPRAPDRATLILLAHPRCPCTRASIGELALLMARCRGDGRSHGTAPRPRLTAYVLFVRPAGFPRGWERTDLWRSAAAIPGVRVLCDNGGTEARRFGAATSGQTLLYDAAGRLLFRGGITGSRGHAGDNAGRSAIVALLTQGTSERTQTFVFGCPLFGAASERSEGSEVCCR